jgi:GGDEF domain-containing protein
MYAPIYKGNAPFASVEERRANLVGYVFGAFRTIDLISAILTSNSSDMSVAVFDGTKEDKESLLYSNSLDKGGGAESRFKGTAHVSVSDQTWTLVVHATPAFEVSAGRALPAFILGGGIALSLLVMGVMRASTNQRKKALELASLGEKLEHTVGILQNQTRELNELRELSDVLQNCKAPSEAFSIITIFVKSAFKDSSGGIFLIDNSRSMVEAGMTWGELSTQPPDSFHPDECWSLRRSKPNLVGQEDTLTQCSHVSARSKCYMCMPMTNHGEAIGVFHFMPPQGQGKEWFKRNEALALMLCEQVSVALGGLKLRDYLRQQSIRDPLTGLFNRRYLEETLQREERRAARESVCIGIIVMDVDHFKRLNDTYGHDTGDHALRQIGAVLRKALRESDIPCRYDEPFIVHLIANCL